MALILALKFCHLNLNGLAAHEFIKLSLLGYINVNIDIIFIIIILYLFSVTANIK